MNKVMLYYSGRNPDLPMMKTIRERQINQAKKHDVMSIGVTAAPVKGFDISIHQPRPGGEATLFKAIQHGLKYVSDGSMVYLCEDDVLYPDTYWQGWLNQYAFHFPDKWEDCWCYDLNVVNLCNKGFFQHFTTRESCYLSCSWAYIDVMKDYVARKIKDRLDPNVKQFSYEPGGKGWKVNYMSGAVACVDIRHIGNTTWRHEGQPLFQNEYGWGSASELIEKYHVEE